MKTKLNKLLKIEIVYLIIALLGYSCSAQKEVTHINHGQVQIGVGAENTKEYYPILRTKKLACVVNHTSVIQGKHLLDTLVNAGLIITKIFTPEHGLKGTFDAGEHVLNDEYKGIPIISLYGDNKKPNKTQFNDVDVVVFDMQDVGVRFYTYISTLHYIMEACAESGITLLVLDRPNPHAHYTDGPVLKSGFESFIGMHKVPVCYGMTIGEYAMMINGEGWLKDKIKCNLTVVKNTNYQRETFYEIPIKPSPNLPNKTAIQLYPSICFFEGTVLSLGRGTNKQFQVVGHPSLKSDFSFMPMPNEGAKEPVLNGQLCYGKDYSNTDVNAFFKKGRLEISYLYEFYNQFSNKKEFFLKNNFFDKLAGSDAFRKQIISGQSELEIRDSWKSDLLAFDIVRKKYLLYE